MNPTRRLAAMMQRDEQEGLAKARRFSSVVEEQAFELCEVELVQLKMDPLTKPLDGDPRYQNLLDPVGFP